MIEGQDADAIETVATEIAEAPEAAAQAEAAPPSIEDLAGEMGWKPKEQWRGEPENWRPAEQFLRHTITINQSMAKDLKKVRADSERMARTSAAIVEEQVARRVAAIEAKFEAAVEAGDSRAAYQASQEIAAARSRLSDADTPEARFRADNPWYEANPEATAVAVAVSHRLQHLPAEQQLEAAEDAVRKRFPELFDAKPVAKAAPLVNAPNTRSTTPARRPKTIHDLPQSAQAAAAMMVRKGLIPDASHYVKVWLAEQAA